MRYGEAFDRLGFTLEAPRLDWTAANESGVALTLWRGEIDWTARPLLMDTRLHAGPIELWGKAGNNKRKRHLRTAINEHNGWVDVVIVTGVPGGGADRSDPWVPSDRRNLRWRVRDLDDETGHFIAEALPDESVRL